ncbi:MAG: hypothetical protein WD873_06685, partial [Candidatus Hydrogenedentales bacterium]
MLRGTTICMGLSSALLLTACATQPAPLQTTQVVERAPSAHRPQLLWPTEDDFRIINSGFG